MKRIIIILAILLSFAIPVNADLNLLGQGTSTHGTYNLIYDTVQDITWYDYTNWQGLDNSAWQNQVDWADALSVDFGGNTLNDFRLPTTVDGLYVYGYDGTTTGGHNITSSEMGHLFYTELGNVGKYDIFGNLTGCVINCLTNTDDFQNLEEEYYWSGTENATDSVRAWGFYFYSGNQFNHYKYGDAHGIAVMDGMAVIPEPISSILFITGGTLLAGRRYLKRRKWKK